VEGVGGKEAWEALGLLYILCVDACAGTIFDKEIYAMFSTTVE
jgi:hypothetical protein